MDRETLNRRRLGQRIRALREAQRLTQQELADRACLSRSYITQIEGSTKSVSFETISRIADALGVALAELVSEDDSEQPAPEPVTGAYLVFEQLAGLKSAIERLEQQIADLKDEQK